MTTIKRRFEITISADGVTVSPPLPNGNDGWTKALQNEIQSAVFSAVQGGCIGGYELLGCWYEGDLRLAPYQEREAT